MAIENPTPAVTVSMAPTFELGRFAWGTPDRLEISGTFGGLPEPVADAAPILVVRAGDSVHRLPAVPESLDGPPVNGRVWHAQFVWQDPPVAFRTAELQLAADLVVELPEPGAKRRLARHRMLTVRTTPTETNGAASGMNEAASETAQPAREDRASVNGRVESVGSQAELLAAQEEVREVRGVMEQAQAELARAREDLQAERERRAADGERFREGLAKLRESAEEALTAEQVTVTQLGADLRDALTEIEAKNAALEALRAELEAADAARMQALAKAEAEAEGLRAQLSRLESDAEETERLRSELASRAAQIDATRAELEQAQSTVDRARSDAERLLSRLTSTPAR
jgi:chromosome segregation ATPase